MEPNAATIGIPTKNMFLVLLKLIQPCEVQLCRFVQNIWNPSESFIDPEYEPNKAEKFTVRTPVLGVTTDSRKVQEKTLCGAITKFFTSATSSKKTQSKFVSYDKIETIKVTNIVEFFNHATEQPAVRDWLARCYSSGCKPYMITGYSVAENLRVSTSAIESTTNVDPCGMVARVTGIGADIFAEMARCDGQTRTNTHSAENILAFGKTVWAINYRKVEFKAKIDNYVLDKPPTWTNDWKVMFKTRGQTEKLLLLEAELGEWDYETLTDDCIDKWEEYPTEGDGDGKEIIYIFPEVHNGDSEDEEEDEQAGDEEEEEQDEEDEETKESEEDEEDYKVVLEDDPDDNMDVDMDELPNVGGAGKSKRKFDHETETIQNGIKRKKE